MMSNVSIMASPPAWTSFDGMLSTPADLSFFSDFTVASTSSRRIGWLSLLIGGGTSSTLGSPVIVCVYNSEQYSLHLFRMSCSSVIFPCFVLDDSSSPLFRACQFFHKLVCFLAVVSLKVFFDTLALFFNPCLLCFSHAFSNLLVGFSIKFCTFRCILLLFQFSPFVAQL